MNKSNELNLLVSEKREVAKDIFEYRFAAHDGSALPSFSPGSHIAVMTPSGANRQYSLINEGDELFIISPVDDIKAASDFINDTSKRIF